MIVCKMQLIDLIWLFVEHFYQTDQQQQEMGGLEIQLKTALPPSIFGVMLMMIMPGSGFWTFQEALTDW